MRAFRGEDAWWRANRDHKDLFFEEFEEFEETLKRIVSAPEIGQRYRFVRGRLIQRWRMEKTGCHVYYHFDASAGVVEIHTIWGARRKGGSKL